MAWPASKYRALVIVGCQVLPSLKVCFVLPYWLITAHIPRCKQGHEPWQIRVIIMRTRRSFTGLSAKWFQALSGQ